MMCRSFNSKAKFCQESARGERSEFVLLNVVFCLSESFQLGRQCPGGKSHLEPSSQFRRGSRSHKVLGEDVGKQASQRYVDLLWCVWTLFLHSDLALSPGCWGTSGEPLPGLSRKVLSVFTMLL